MVGGDAAAFARAKPLFEIMGKNIALLGAAGAGQDCKMANQIAVAVGMVAWVEALAYAKKAGLDPAAVRLFQASSNALPPGFLLDEGLAPVRIASIDGGHTAPTTYHDLVLVSCALADGGVVILDDFFSHGWPGATDGLFRFLLLRNHSLAPFLEARDWPNPNPPPPPPPPYLKA